MACRTWLKLWLALAVTPALHVPAGAASFDCTQAKAAREKVICGDPGLSNLDSELGRLYQERRALLSSHGAELLRRSQQNWLRFVTTVCPAKAASDSEAKNCLKREYNQRLKQLAMAGQRHGPFVFNRIDLFSADRASDDSGTRAGFQYQHSAFPQIDNSNTPAIIDWNNGAKTELPLDGFCDGDGDYSADYFIGYANKNMISFSFFDQTYCHGTNHGFGSSKVKNTVLHPTPHDLKAAEIFGANDEWVPKLQALFWKSLKKQGWAPPNDNEKDEILSIVVQANRWLFTPEGLEVNFNSYEGGCYACTPHPARVSWEDLKGILSRESVVP